MTLIVFEGLDCTGKTTTAKGLAERLKQKGQNAVYNKTKQTILSKHFPSESTYLIDSLIDENKIIIPSLRSNIIVQDRYFFSVLSYNAAITGNRLLRYAIPFFTEPDVVFYLYADDEIREKRWHKGGEKGFPLSFQDLNLAHKVDKEYRDLLSDYNTHFVDTSKTTTQQAVENIYNCLMQRH